jgi:hypothetical protein
MKVEKETRSERFWEKGGKSIGELDREKIGTK